MDTIKTWILDRIDEKSTWLGVATVLAPVLGFTISPENLELIATSFATLAGVALVVINTKKKS